MQEKSDLEHYYDGRRWPFGLILASAFFASLYGFFAFGYSDDPKFCEAPSKDDVITNFPGIDSMGDKPQQGSVNVAWRFRFFFKAAFYISVV